MASTSSSSTAPAQSGALQTFPSRRLALQGVATLAMLAALPRSARPMSKGRRVALVIGNGDYRYVPKLANPTHDAKLIAATLGDLGFALVGGRAHLDLDKDGFAQVLAAFGNALKGADTAVFYYSGHGMQVGGTNWLVPVSADPRQLADLPAQMVSATGVLREVAGARTRLTIVILDACRDNPFALADIPPPTAAPILAGRSQTGAASRGMGQGGGLAVMQAPPGTLISYATQPGNVALDGLGSDSPFSAALAKVMREPGLSLFQMFNRVGLLVERTTQGMQQPWISTSPIEGDFSFSGSGPGTPLGSPADRAPMHQVQRPATPLSKNPFDGVYEGIAPGGGVWGCKPVDMSITVKNGAVTGTGVIIGPYAPFKIDLFTRTMTGRVTTNGSTTLRFHFGSHRGMGIPGRFVAGRFEGMLGGKNPACMRTVTLYRR